MRTRHNLILIMVLLAIPGLLWAADGPGKTISITKVLSTRASTAATAGSQSPVISFSASGSNSSKKGRGIGNSPETTGKETVLEFKTMVGVDGPFLGNANPIRGVPGGGRPWVLDLAHGRLRADGDLDILVKGLIIPASEGPQFGINPAGAFRAIVSCLTVDGFGNVVEENIITDPEDTQMIGDPENGDAHIRARIDLPDPCVAPIIFVTSQGGSWFASTGAGVIPASP
ncbi:MAG: hypothetical protein QME75_15035 [Deltaproteobacteria bacterium]|nr:hypothetical protein [Deltaproteobacteria bacterium]